MIKKTIMSSNEFNLARIEALEKRIQELEGKVNYYESISNSLSRKVKGCKSAKCPCKQKEV